MKINKVVNLCKKNKTLVLITDEKQTVQWLSDGNGWFPILGLPYFKAEQFCLAFDISVKKQEKMLIQEKGKLPEQFCFSDNTQEDSICKREDFGFAFDERSAIPLVTELGIKFIDKKYLEPLSDVEQEVNICTRYDKSGQMYFVLKVGMLLYGVVKPMENIVTEDFIQKLKTLTKLCQSALENDK